MAFIIQKSKKIILPGFNGLPLYDVVKFFINQVNRVGLNDRAAAISFNLIMAIPAACIFIFTLVPYLPIAKEFNTELLRLTKDLTPNQNTYGFVKAFLDDFFNRSYALVVSFRICSSWCGSRTVRGSIDWDQRDFIGLLLVFHAVDHAQICLGCYGR